MIDRRLVTLHGSDTGALTVGFETLAVAPLDAFQRPRDRDPAAAHRLATGPLGEVTVDLVVDLAELDGRQAAVVVGPRIERAGFDGGGQRVVGGLVVAVVVGVDSRAIGGCHAERFVSPEERLRGARERHDAGDGHRRQTAYADPQPAAEPLPAPHADVHFHARKLRPR